MGRIIGIIIGLVMIIGGLSGALVLRGTNSSIALVVIGLISVVFNIIVIIAGENKIFAKIYRIFVFSIAGGSILLLAGLGISSFVLNKTHYETCANSVYVLNDDVYVAGWAEKRFKGEKYNSKVACIWKNGKIQYLTDEKVRAEAFCVFADNDDVYIGGRIGVNAVIWKNGVVQRLTKFNNDVSISSSVGVKYIFVSENGDVFAAGIGGDEQNYKTYSVVWKNGQVLYENKGSSMYVSGEDVYTTGDKTWKNGMELYENGGGAVFVFNDDVYVIGSRTWKNDEIIYKNGGSSIFVSDDNVYVTNTLRHTEGWIHTIWINGIEYKVHDKYEDSYIQAGAVFVNNDDIYVAGYGRNKGNYIVAKLWKNGIEQELDIIRK